MTKTEVHLERIIAQQKLTNELLWWVLKTVATADEAEKANLLIKAAERVDQILRTEREISL